MAPRKRQQKNNPRAPRASRMLPADLLLAIAARSDARTIVRCAATSKSLRREIADPSFIRQAATGVVPTRILLAHTRRHRRKNHRRKPFVSLVHPATPAAMCFTDKHLAPFVARSAADDLLGRYDPVTSRGGLIVLVRRHYVHEHRYSDLCVYDPMTGDRTFLSKPPGISFDRSCIGCPCHPCVLLTAADGVNGSSFLLFFAHRAWCQFKAANSMRIQMAALSDNGNVSWGPVTEHFGAPLGNHHDEHDDAVVLPGGVIHWLQHGSQILTYDVSTRKLGTVELPAMPTNNKPVQRHLRTSPDRRLRFLVADVFMITMWIQLPGGHGWERQAVIDMEEKLRLFEPNVPVGSMVIQFKRSGERNNTVMLRIHGQRCLLIVLDLETKEIRRQHQNPSLLFEVDLSERLQGMKIFS
ncbi:hypothetical protein VPH35_114397 [Triticum aestivum]